MLGTQLQRLPEIVRDAGPVRLFLVYGVLHGALAAFGYALAVPGIFFTAFWPAAGLLLAACVICRRRQRWILLAASTAAEFIAGWVRAKLGHFAIGVGPVLYLAVVQALVYGLSALMVERWWRVPLPAGLSKLAQATGVVALVLAGGIAVGAAGLAWYFDMSYLIVLQAWLMSQMLGAIAVTPLIITWWMALTGYAGEVVGSRTELLVLVLIALIATYAIFANWPTTARFQPIYFLFPILLWAAMRFPPRYVAPLGLGIACLAAALTSAGQGPFAHRGEWFWASLLPLQLFMNTVILSALFLSVANYERRRSEQSLRRYALALANAEDRARRRTAADLHDGIGQELFGVCMSLAATRRHIVDPQAAHTLAESLKVLDGIVTHTRKLIEELDPPWIHDLDLPRAVEWLAGRFIDRAGLKVDVHAQGEVPVLTVEERSLLFRSVRELLQNVVRHAGIGSATVELLARAEVFEIIVHDAGRGFDIRFDSPGELHGGFGLFSVREQLAAHGAHLRIETAPGHGCTVTIVWPQRRRAGPGLH